MVNYVKSNHWFAGFSFVSAQKSELMRQLVFKGLLSDVTSPEILVYDFIDMVKIKKLVNVSF